MNRVILRGCSWLILLLAETAGLRAQFALDGFDPNANGRVSAIVVQPDGKIIIGGDFTSVSPNGGAAVTRNRMARFNPDGTLDVAFNPNANLSVRAIAVQPDGKILAAGRFLSIGGQNRNRIARLDATTGAADSFDPNASADVYTVAVQADGKILVGGQFATIGGQTRNHIARLDAATGLADSFNPNSSGNVFDIAVQPDGKIVAGGNFASIGGQTRNRIARLDPATGLADSFNPNADFFIEALAIQADGKVLVGGGFTSIGGQTRNHIARLNSDGTLDTAFDSYADAEVLSIVVEPDANILVGGTFTSIGPFGGSPRSRLARLNGKTGALDRFFDPHSNNTVQCIAVQSDGKILAGGDFTVIGGDLPSPPTAVSRNRIVRLASDGKIDQTLNLGMVGDLVFATAVQPDGKILIGGSFTKVLGVAKSNIARLNTDGTLDTSFNTTANGRVWAIAVQNDGKILLGGEFSTINGSTRPWLGRVQGGDGIQDGTFNPDVNGRVFAIAVRADGRILLGGEFTSVGGQTRNGLAELGGINATTVDGFNPNANATPVYTIALQSDEKLLVSGAFTSIGGQTRNHLARLDAFGAADSFNPDADGAVLAIAMHADGKILAGGQFNNIGGQARNRLARLDPTTGAADSFNPNANGDVNSITVQSDGKILAGGAFTSIGGQTRNRLARLDPASGAADSFNPNANTTVYSIALEAGGKVLAGGLFTMIGGQSRNRFARLSNDTAALSALKVTQTAITLMRAGSAPQFTHVTFGIDSEFDGLFGLVGSGIPQGSSYTLTGLNLPTRQSFLIRSRGYFRTGYFNGSETTEYNFKNVLLRKLSIISITRSGADVMITYDANAANTYRLESKLALTDPDWLPITGVADQAPNLDGPAIFTVPNAIASGRMFYRVVLAPASTQVPLNNPNFETAPFADGIVTGWNVTGHVAANPEGATSPTRSAALTAGFDSQGDTLSQSFSTITGRNYSVDFDAGIFGQRTGSPLQVNVQVIGNATLLNQTITPPDASTFTPANVTFQHYHFTFTADSSNTALRFSSVGLGNAAADQLIDTVTVNRDN